MELNHSATKQLSLIVLMLCCLSYEAVTQTIRIQPYLQDAAPHSIYILWETDFGEESIVEWGLTDVLGNESVGLAYTSDGEAMVHEVYIEGLERFTQYYYRVKTDNAISEIFRFKTPPFASDHESFRLVAMSDMQRDGAFPNKFQEIVEEGVLNYLNDEFGAELIDNLALVMIPGDLVTNGNDFDSWKNTFFNPAEKLFSYVPVYPVLGNHENNSPYYFTYFKMPDNGTPDYEEHWWYKDYGNLRIVGLNSNSPFTNVEQLDWLDDILYSTCDSDSIDFVFAQLHHPHKSELWTPGESDFTGEVISKLEQFTTECNKPSIHFFGHTHGYSRGQSRDHKHLWINVASAGGAIDNWGEFPNFDYDEFSVSQDEYGFVMVEVTDSADPKLVVKRISRGDQDITIDNQLTDSLTIRLIPSIVDPPEPIFPIGEEGIAPECVTLVGSEFSSPNINAVHGQSHWQLTTSQNGFDNPIIEHWKNFENWYYDIDTQANDDLTDEEIIGLDEFTTYFWRLRYRDREMNWSEWSNSVAFTTGASIALPNLLVNPGAEDDTNDWIVVEGVFEALESGDCNGVMPNNGNKYFSVGGLCEHSEIGRVIQDINMEEYIDSIDSGGFLVHYGGYLSNYSGSDLPEMKVIFLDENHLEIGEGSTISTLNNAWTLLSSSDIIPEQTRTIQVELKGTRNAGTDNDSYFDDLFLSVGTPHEDCDFMVSATKSPNVQSLNIFPNPGRAFTTIEIPEFYKEDFILGLINSEGDKIQPSYQKTSGVITINLSDLPQGMYLVYLRGSHGLTHVGKLIVTD